MSRNESSTDAHEGHRGASVLPKILAVVAVINLLRMIANHRGGSSGGAASWRDRRKAMIAELHRELHRADEQQADAAEGSATA
jgi:molybdenum-dependent DNA-binding transcriptional regulator ModE